MSEPAGTRDHAATEAVEAYYIASQWQLMWRKFRRHHLAIAAASFSAVFYFVAIFCDFFLALSAEPAHRGRRSPPSVPHPPVPRGATGRTVRIRRHHRVDAEAFRKFYTDDRSVRYPLRFFTAGAEYRLLGLFPTRVRLFGVDRPERCSCSAATS